MLHMDDDLAVVDQHPATVPLALAAHRLGADLAKLVLDLVDDRLDLSFVACGGDQKGVGDRELFADVEGDEVAGQLVGRGARGGVHQLDGMFSGGHTDSESEGESGDLIEIVFGDVLDDAVRHEVPHRLAASLPLAAVGRGDGQGWDLDQGHPIGRDRSERGRIHGVTRTSATHELRQLEEFLRLAPGEDLRQRIGSGDEVEVGIGHLGAEGRAACRRCTSVRRGRCPPATP